MSMGSDMMMESMCEEYGLECERGAARRDAIEQFSEKLMHKSKDGTKVSLEDLTDKHLDNILVYLEKQPLGNYEKAYSIEIYNLEKLRRMVTPTKFLQRITSRGNDLIY